MVRHRETAAQQITRLEREKAELLSILDHYIPATMMKPPTAEYERWLRDNERLCKLSPSWR